MININAHIRAAENLRNTKSSIENLISTLRSAQEDIYANEVEGLEIAGQQLNSMISNCSSMKASIDGVANSIIQAAKAVYAQELAEYASQRTNQT